jgi:hypothetical protein
MAPLDGWQHIEARAVAIGWLGDFVPQSGQVSEVEMRVLRHFRSHYTFCDGLMGLHTCEICHQAELHNEFWVGYGGVRYVLPVGIFHYIEAHDYCPPKEFLAVLHALAEKSCLMRIAAPRI